MFAESTPFSTKPLALSAVAAFVFSQKMPQRPFRPINDKLCSEQVLSEWADLDASNFCQKKKMQKILDQQFLLATAGRLASGCVCSLFMVQRSAQNKQS
jgi:hypothetical protein